MCVSIPCTQLSDHGFLLSYCSQSLIKQKIKDFKKESKSMNDWMDETERLVKSLSVDMDPKKATKIQQKINVSTLNHQTLLRLICSVV